MKSKLITKLDRQGRFTIPGEVREELGLEPHDFVTVQSDGRGSMIVKKIDILAV